MKPIQMVDLKTQYNRLQKEIDEALLSAVRSTAYINGPEVKQFRTELGKFHAIPEAVTCGNGTDALQIAMMALGLEPGDEVILPVHTYVATAEVIALLKLVPVFVDVDYDRFTIDPSAIEERITSKTKAIAPVHLYGQCADMEPVLSIAKKHNLFVVEDTAQAIGATYSFSDGRSDMAGTMGDLGTLSFFPSKNLGCFGDGGAIVSKNEELLKKSHLIANHGQTIKYHHDIVGCNSRLDTVQAAVLLTKLKHLEDFASRRKAVADFYDGQLADIDAISTPFRYDNSDHVFHQYTIKVKDGKREALKDHLQKKGIPSMIYYPVPLHLQKAYASEKTPEGRFPVTERLSKEVLSLPMHTEMEEDQQAFIAEEIKNFFQG